jgi:hypothetical protein
VGDVECLCRLLQRYARDLRDVRLVSGTGGEAHLNMCLRPSWRVGWDGEIGDKDEDISLWWGL